MKSGTAVRAFYDFFATVRDGLPIMVNTGDDLRLMTKVEGVLAPLCQ